jgi:hypothetical protein
LKVIATIAGVIVLAICALDMTIQWAGTWRYLLSQNFREHTRQRWSNVSRFSAAGQVAFAVFCFVVVNVPVAAVLWFLLVGPLTPVHSGSFAAHAIGA